MTATGKATRYPRTFGLRWVGEVPQQAARVGLSGSLLLLERDPVLEVAGTFTVQRGGNSQSICQADWRVEGVLPNPVLAEHFQGGLLPSGQVFFAAGAVEVPVSFLLSPGAEPPTELAGQVVLENLVNCELAAGRGELPLSIAADVIGLEAVVSLEVPFTEMDPEAEAPVGEVYTYALNLAGNRTIPGTNGADCWPSTWAENGNVYTTFGDGPGTESSPGYVSLGLARFTGTTLAGLGVQYLVGGPGASVRARWDPVAGLSGAGGELNAKCTSLIAHDDNLYLWLADGTPGTRGWDNCRIGRVSLSAIGAGPTVPSWGMGTAHTWKTINPVFLQVGKNFDQAWDGGPVPGYVYAFPQHYAPVENPGDSPSHNPARFYLMRCRRDTDWLVQSNWEWWTGNGSFNAAPTWGIYANRQPRITMSGQCDWRGSAFFAGGVYPGPPPAPTIQTCVFRIGRTGDPAFGGGSMSRFATFVAARPWHEWTMIADQQYTASGIDPDLAQISPIPSTITYSSPDYRVATWVDTTWGGDNTDRCILAPSTLTVAPA
jgi:hypothetical protein